VLSIVIGQAVEDDPADPPFQRALEGKSVEFGKHPQETCVEDLQRFFFGAGMASAHPVHDRKKLAVQAFLTQAVVVDTTGDQFFFRKCLFPFLQNIG